jgi:hypothetical protein
MSIAGKQSIFKHGSSATPSVLVDYSIAGSGLIMSVKPTFDGEEVDMTVWGDGFRSFEQSFKNATMALIYKLTPATFTALTDLYKSGNEVDFEIGPMGDDAGNPKITGTMFIKKIDPPMDVGEGLKINADARITGEVTFDTY